MTFDDRYSSTPLSDAIWNRAVTADPLPPDARRGDRALRDAAELHGYVMNGGLDHGLDVMGTHGVEQAAAGWEYLGGRDVGALLREALRAVPDMPLDREERETFFIDGWTDEQAKAVEQLDSRYPDDDVLEQAFLSHLSKHPEDFLPAAQDR
jgi:hypothetical protein